MLLRLHLDRARVARHVIASGMAHHVFIAAHKDSGNQNGCDQGCRRAVLVRESPTHSDRDCRSAYLTPSDAPHIPSERILFMEERRGDREPRRTETGEHPRRHADEKDCRMRGCGTHYGTTTNDHKYVLAGTATPPIVIVNPLDLTFVAYGPSGPLITTARGAIANS